MLHTLRECEEIGTGDHVILDVGPPHVLVHRATTTSGGAMLFLHNLADQPAVVDVGVQSDQPGRPLNVAMDGPYGAEVDLDKIELAGYGYRWIRLRKMP